MPKAPLLSDADIQLRLRSPWQRRGKTIERTWEFEDFSGALGFVNRIAVPSEEQNHHPDVFIHWNEVTLTLWTHASGGITERDLRLADSIDALTES